MASLGWLVSLARGEDKAKEDAVLAQFRAAKDKVPHDPRAAWDWYYLNLALGDNSGDLRGGPRPQPRRARGPDGALDLPLARWARASSARGRASTSRGDRGGRRHAPAAARRDRSRPGRVPHPPPAPARAGRAADPRQRRRRAEAGQAGRRGETLYREAVDGARQLDEVASVLRWPASAGTSRA